MTACNTAFRRFLVSVLIAVAPSACTIAPPPSLNPFVGSWSTAERQQIAFRDDTVVFSPPGEKPTPLGAETCSGKFRFAYNRQSRDALLAMVGRQADLRGRLAEALVQPQYPVAELSCGEGGTTYVMLSDKELVAIHRDHDIAGVERWSRL